jgi:pimeloyl-ACP methyl ester carboxylesterase
MTDRGQGPCIVLIPGIQGRWEWMRPAIDALSANARVLSFSLNEFEPDVGLPGAPGAETFDAWVRGTDALLDGAGVPRAAIAGVSFGGLIAFRYAAHRPDRTSRLLLVSAPPPRWEPDDRQRRYLRHPRLALPAFAAHGVTSLLPEILAARRTWRSRLSFGLFVGLRAVRYPVSPRRMARWVRAWMATDLEADCRRVAAPTLVITGEPHLDRQVPVSGTRLYLDLISGARHAELAATGHIGLVSRPREFAALVMAFIGDTPRAAVTSHAYGIGQPVGGAD